MNKNHPVYTFNPQGEFVLKNYNFAKPFANFFPGIAGKYGIPMWAFYVNRGQAMVSFGTKNKNGAIMEFFPANKAWQLASLHGFRTFIKLSSGKKTVFYEPFHNGFTNLGFKLTNQMQITSYDLKLEETNASLGLQINVEYFSVPNDNYAGLARIVTIKNLKKKSQRLQILDGLPQIVPFGTSNLFLKQLGRTIEAWMNVNNLDKGVPFYKLEVDPTDRPEVIQIQEGNFYLSFYSPQNKPQLIKPIVDPESVFGTATDFAYPANFLAAKKFLAPQKEITRSKMPCGFSLLNLNLRPDEEKTFYSVIGYMRSCACLNASVKKIIQPYYLSNKRQENKEIIQSLQQDIFTKSNSPEFDLYAQQTYLDNILRGGYPFIFKDKQQKQTLYLYARKHGDLERDYNKFQLEPTYFSQGNGNYRDMNQNRRSDIWFNPEIEEENLLTFFNLLQTDGFNPLVLDGATFSLLDPQQFKNSLKGLIAQQSLERLLSFLEKPFSPGNLVLFMEENRIKLKVSCDEFLNRLIPHCQKHERAEHGDGFWTDHWTYNLDLLENYLGVYPERLKEILFTKREFTFFDNAETVKPRSEKYLLYGNLPRQLHALATDSAKKELIRKRLEQAHIVRTQCGKGEIYKTNLMNKLLCIAANKLASLDPFGVGIEMETDKPNWFDALNGLPALFGSSLSETMELKRLILLIKDAFDKTGIDRIYITEEVHNLLLGLDNLIKEYLESNYSQRDYRYWDTSASLKEEYRQRTKLGLSGSELEMLTTKLMPILKRALEKIEIGIVKAYDRKANIYCAYFINEVAEYEPLKKPFIKPTRFIQKKVAFFLESQMHALRITDDIKRAKVLYQGIKTSPLFDQPLKMYKVTAPLQKMPLEIGRCCVFTPGWLENESIWTHMEYKYLLEVLKAGLYKEFYEDFKNALVPFQKPAIYGRSTLENSSFIVSSAFPDKNLHGNGFVARLSGASAEFLEIWRIINSGKIPFFLNEKGELSLRLSPVLAGWLFSQKDKTYSFNFLSKILVTYYNPKRKDTFGKSAVSIKKIVFNDRDGRKIELPSDTIPHPYAEQVRSRQITQINIFLG